jgi:HSP20 family protein
MKPFFSDDFFNTFSEFSELLTSSLVDTDILEEEDKVVIELFLAGVKKGDIDISVNDRTLTVDAERKKSTLKSRSKGVYYGKIHKSFKLPSNYDSSKITSTYVDGVLSIKIPKITQDEVRKSAKINID